MEEEQIIVALREMEADSSFITESAYRANAEVWPKNRISFVDNHLAYLKAHPSVNPEHYLANLRLMIRKTTLLR